jgi:hypothetical protein
MKNLIFVFIVVLIGCIGLLYFVDAKNYYYTKAYVRNNLIKDSFKVNYNKKEKTINIKGNITLANSCEFVESVRIDKNIDEYNFSIIIEKTKEKCDNQRKSESLDESFEYNLNEKELKQFDKIIKIVAKR